MELTNLQVYDITLALAELIRSNRPMPVKGKYWIGRLHKKLKPAFDEIVKHRDAIIEGYDYEEPLKNDDGSPKMKTVKVKDADGNETDEEKEVVETVGYKSVPKDKFKDFEERWKAIYEEKDDYVINPVPFDMWGDAVSTGEFQILEPLIVEPA